MRPRTKRSIKTPKPFKKPRCKSYFIRVINVSGKRELINLGTSDKKEARLRAKEEVDLINSKLDGSFSKVAVLSEIIDEYFQAKTGVVEESTILRNKQHVTFFLNFMRIQYPQRKYINQVTARHISDFQNSRKETKVKGRKVSLNTVRESIGVLNTIFEWALKRSYVNFNPVKKIDKVRFTRQDQHVFEDEEIILLLEFCKHSKKHQHLYAPYLTFATTGMRSGELSNLIWADIDFENKRIKVRSKILPDGREWKTKTKQNRELIMDDEVFNALLDLKIQSSSEWVFMNSKGRRLSGYMLWANLISLCKRLNIKRGMVHSFRRSFAIMMDKSVNDRVAIQQTLGHTTMTMTDRYCGQRKKDYVDKAHLKTTTDFVKKMKEVEQMAQQMTP